MTSRTIFACFAVAGSAAAIAACGSDVPAGSVAKVGGTVITKQEFQKWLHTASAGASQGGGSAVTPDPPDFTSCVAARKRTPQPGAAGKQTDAALKKQCKQDYDRLKGEVMQFLIQAQWV